MIQNFKHILLFLIIVLFTDCSTKMTQVECWDIDESLPKYFDYREPVYIKLVGKNKNGLSIVDGPLFSSKDILIFYITKHDLKMCGW